MKNLSGLKSKLLLVGLVSLALAGGIFAAARLTPAQAKADPVSRIQNTKLLKVCSDAGFVPFQMKTAQGAWEGYDVEMMRAFAKELNVGLEMIQVNFDGIIPALMAGKCDLIASGMTVTPERAKAVSFSAPTFTNTLSIATDVGPNAQKYAAGLAALDQPGNKIAVKTGYTSDLYLRTHLKTAQVLRFDNDADLVTAVKQGRAQALMIDTTFLDSFEQKQPGLLALVETVPTQEHFAVAAKKQDASLIKKFNQFLSSWKQSAQHREIYQSYFPASFVSSTK